MHRIALPAALVLLGSAGAAHAHPRLVSTSPAPNATVAGPARVELRFSEALMPKFSGADVTMTGHDGTGHAPMKIPVVAGIVGDGHTLVVTPRAPLGAGRYNVAWHVVSTDTHRIAGTFAFVVK